MQQVILVLHVLAAVAIIALVLMQHGRGADVGASFGSGSSNTMFGSVGALPFLMKVTVVCAALFFATSLSLSYLATSRAKQADVLNIPTVPQQPQPATTKPSDVNAATTFAPAADMRQDTKQDESKK